MNQTEPFNIRRKCISCNVQVLDLYIHNLAEYNLIYYLYREWLCPAGPTVCSICKYTNLNDTLL